MSKEKRLKIVDQIQKSRESILIAYITSTRQNLEVQMAMDQVRKVYEHLRLLTETPKKDKKIDLFLHTNGGDGTVPWRLVNLIREYSSRFTVLVPNNCFSAGTLTALGADEILMHPMGMLGPTDPTVVNPFNPTDPNNPSRKIGISVEDVTAYISLLKEDAGIHHEDELIQGFTRLADKVHPLALGNVKRSLSQSRMMANKLLKLHMQGGDNEHKIKEIVDNLTSKLFYHGHPINRIEAVEQVGICTVKIPPTLIEDQMWELYVEYEEEMKMEQPFDITTEFLDKFPAQNPGDTNITDLNKTKLAFIESEKRSDVYVFQYNLSGAKQPDSSTKVTLLVKKQGWELE